MSPLTTCNPSLASRSSSSATFGSFRASFSLSSARTLATEACFKSDLCFKRFLSQFPYLGLKNSPLGGQGRNLSLVRLRCPGGALSKAGPPCQAFRISSHLPKKMKKKKKESAHRTETIKKMIDESTWTYRGGSLKKKIQSLLDEQGTHPPEVGVA